jgi:ABC-2 type transport system ATP-binding protein
MVELCRQNGKPRGKGYGKWPNGVGQHMGGKRRQTCPEMGDGPNPKGGVGSVATLKVASSGMTKSGEFAVVTHGLRKTFGEKVAVDGVDLAVPRGSMFGIVGPNGAGKTTSIKMMVGLLRPDSGSVVIAGNPTWPDPVRVKRNLGVVPDGLSLFDRLTGYEHVHYAGMLRGLSDADAKVRAGELIDVLGLASDAKKLVIDYSHGMRKKVALASALIHRPEVLVLDEPFEGIDPVSAVNIRAVLDRYRSAGGTVVLSSHIMDIVERLCDHVAVIAEGRVRAQGSIEELRVDGRRLEEVFVELVGGDSIGAGSLSWLTN